MKTSFALIAAATSVFVFTQAAAAQCDCQQTVSYYAPVATTAYYAPATAYYAPTTAYYAPTTAYYPTSAYYAPTTAYYGGGGYYGRLLSRRGVRHRFGRLGRCSWNRPKVGSSRVVNGEHVAASGLRGIERRGTFSLRCQEMKR